MSYATVSDLIAWCGMSGQAELVELTDPDNTTLNTTVVQAKLDQADNEINSRLVGVSLPMEAPYPRLLIDIACRIARYFLYATGRPQYVTDDFTVAIKTLDDIRMGKASLGLSSDQSSVVGGTGGPVVSAPSSVFSEDVLSAL